MSFLQQVRLEKLKEVEALLEHPPRIVDRADIRSLKGALSGPEVSAIAEIKRRSPTRGDIRPDSLPSEIAAQYEAAGAAAISMLTDTPHFGGRLEELKEVRDAVQIPVLRKDFLVHPIQVDESYAAGADAILLIVAMLSEAELKALLLRSQELGLDALVEVHDSEELERATATSAPILGINNRNLKTLNIDLAQAEGLLPQCPEDRIRVAESGLFSNTDVERMVAAGADAILVGSSLMLAEHPGQALEALLCG